MSWLSDGLKKIGGALSGTKDIISKAVGSIPVVGGVASSIIDRIGGSSNKTPSVADQIKSTMDQYFTTAANNINNTNRILSAAQTVNTTANKAGELVKNPLTWVVVAGVVLVMRGRR